jgi:hypothetical protein
MSLEASSIAPRTRLISSSMSVASNWGLLARIFFLVEGFSGETFLFCDVTIPTGGSSSGGVIVSPPPFPSSPSSPPPCPSASSSPLPSELDALSSEALSSSSLSISWTYSFFFFFFVPLDFLTCSTQVTMGLPMVSVSKSSTSAMGTRNSSDHSFVICFVYSSISL